MTMPRIALALLAALGLAACESVPSLDAAKDWFSDSDYDPEIEAIERDTSPPEQPFAPPGANALAPMGPSYVRSASGVVVADPPAGMTVRLGAAEVAAARDVALAAEPVAPSAGRLATVPRPGAGPAAGAARASTGADSVEPAATLTRPADPPPLGWGRARRVIYGQNRAPFRASPYRALR